MRLCVVLSLLVDITVKCTAAVIRQEVERSFIENKEPVGFALHTTLVVDGQAQNAIVDVGSSYLLWIWKTFYESAVGKGACDKLFFKCYECPQPCKPTEPSYVQFGGGMVFEIFKYSGKISVGIASLDGAYFGLISKSNPPPPGVSPVALFGLGPDVDERYPSLMKQLLADPSKPIKDNIFALYLRPGSSDTSKGELLLGGGDESLYQKPLLFVPTIKKDSWTVKLNVVQPEKGPQVVVADGVLLDTGSNTIFAPQAGFTQLIASIGKAVTTGAGEEVKIEYNKDYGVWTVDCQYRSFMPTLHFMLAGSGNQVPLSITYESYVPDADGLCYLLMNVNQMGLWLLPDFMLIGNYLEFQFDQKRVGIAKLK